MEEATGMPELTEDELAFLESVFELAREGRTEKLMGFIEAGVPVNLTHARGDTLLILAAYHRQAETVSFLLRAGVDLSRVNDMGQTALAAATFRNHERIVHDLLKAGADPQVGPQNAIAVARQFGLSDMEFLLNERQRR